MILDNNNEKTIGQYIKQWTDSGELDVVTGYFTIGALAYLSDVLNKNIKKFRFVLGDIVNRGEEVFRSIDLLSENISIDTALNLSITAKKAVNFIKQNKVELKTLEPNFCHAKLYLYLSREDERHNSFISGSSNLTEAGIGLKTAGNIELSIAESGNNNQFTELKRWFDSLFESNQAHSQKTIQVTKRREKKVDFKKYLIEEMSKIYYEYTPKELYYKVLFELFYSQISSDKDTPEFNNQVGRLRDTKVYTALYDFQQQGVLSLIKMLRDYNGAILADAVGLGKTWTALAVMKFYQLQGREIILLCPKKLFHNWNRYRQHQNSRFEKDRLDYFIRFHTDLQDIRLETYQDREDKYFCNDKPKLLVIDESHNLRNSKSGRYKFLVEQILEKNSDIKVLMLSATPINNTLTDIRNQFKIITKGDSRGFYDTHSIRDIDYIFRNAQAEFKKWRESKNNLNISHFIKALPLDFFNLTDSLIVARTRAMVSSQHQALTFPQKTAPKNIFVTPKHIGNIETFEELIQNFPPLLSAYLPSFYIEQAKEVKTIRDERQRDRFLVKMMYILLVKRLESSWFSFKTTIEKLLNHHQNALNKIIQYEETKTDITIEEDYTDYDDFDEIDELSIGKKRPVSISDIEHYNKLDDFKNDLNRDIEKLQMLNCNLEMFNNLIEKELTSTKKHQTKDDKLQSLINEIIEKQKHSNKKVLIFTGYSDTANYLYTQLKGRGFCKIACVSGDTYKSDIAGIRHNNYEPLLERFAPFTKLFIEKEWCFTPSAENMPLTDQYEEWKIWLKDNDNKTYEKINHQIDILIATDVLSEGQNLQDCDMVINYDIHWNPVRVIQRMGRIDRLGSPNKQIFGINYWAAEDVDQYLNLKQRIEQKMATMILAGAEVDLKFTPNFAELANDLDFEDKLNQKMLKQMQNSWDEIETNDKGLGCNNLSLEEFRQDLTKELEEQNSKYKDMPKAVFTGFKAKYSQDGLIALLAQPARPPKAVNHIYKRYDLVFIDKEGNQLLLNQKEVLEFLSEHKNFDRYIPDSIDEENCLYLQSLSDSLKSYLNTNKDKAVPNLLTGLATGNKKAIDLIKNNQNIDNYYKPENVDLLVWFIVSKEN